MKRISVFILTAIITTLTVTGPFSLGAEKIKQVETVYDAGVADAPLDVTALVSASKKNTGLYKEKGVWKYYEKGVFKKATGLVKKASVYNDKTWYYVENGVFKKVTTIAKKVKSDGNWYYVKDGAFVKATGLAKRISDGAWFYVKNGCFDKKAVGLVKRIDNGKWFYVEKGTLKKRTGLVKRYDNGKWFYVKNGAFTTDPDDIVLTAADEKAGLFETFIHVYANAVVSSITKKSMTKEQKLRKCFDYVQVAYRSTNNPRIPHYTGLDWVYVYANDMFGPRKGGNCMSYAASFAFLAKACGYSEVYACNSGGHAWTEIDGLVYDPEQYHDTKNKFYGVPYSYGVISHYWGAISDYKTNKYKRIKIADF